MSMILAQKTKDPKRMADAAEQLLALGWPGQDEYSRLEAANQVDILARSLREDGRGAEADALMAGLTASQARDLFVRLSWDGDADYDLLVDEPLGVTASYQNPRTVFGGAIIKNGYGSHPEEVYVCPRGFDGDYTVHVSMIYTNPDKPVTRLTLETIVHEGASGENKQTIDLVPDKANKPVVVHLTSGRRKKVERYVDSYAELMKAAAETMKGARPPGWAAAQRSCDVKKAGGRPALRGGGVTMARRLTIDGLIPLRPSAGGGYDEGNSGSELTEWRNRVRGRWAWLAWRAGTRGPDVPHSRRSNLS
jgi:hypothetical protein